MSPESGVQSPELRVWRLGSADRAKSTPDSGLPAPDFSTPWPLPSHDGFAARAAGHPITQSSDPNDPYRQFHGQTDRQLDETQLRTPEGPDDAGPAKPPLKAQPVPPGERETKTILPLPPPDDPSDKPKEPNDKPKKRDPYDILRKRKGPSR